MADVELTFTMEDAARQIAGSKEALRAVAAGANPAIVAASRMVGVIKRLVSQPGQGKVYDTEWRTVRTPKGFRAVPIHSLPRPPHRASRPAQPPAPDTGTLRASIGFELLRDTPEETVVRIGSGDKKEKVLALEFGSTLGGKQHILPRPFFRAGILAGRAGMTEALIKSLKRNAQKASKGRAGKSTARGV